MLPSQLFLLLMASRFASQILCFSKCDAVTEHLKDSQKVFISDLISALRTFSKKRKWSRAIISGAAFLYWMFGISESDDVRHTVLGILRNRNSKDINMADDIIVRRVQSAIVAMIETFGNEGKPLNVQKDTEITTSLLASWANNKPTPINSDPEIYQAAQLCVIYKPEDLIASWHDQSRARKYCVHLLVRIAEEVFDGSMEINDEILQEYLAKIRDDEDHVMLENTKKSKGKLAGVEESQTISNDSDANSAVNVVSYPCGRGFRTILDRQGSFESLARSIWLKHKTKNTKEAMVIKEFMTYDQYQTSVSEPSCRVTLSKVKGYHIIALVSDEWRLITIEKFDKEQEENMLNIREVTKLKL